MTTLATDTLQRPNQSGLGTASDGVNVWGSITNGATANIVSDEASINNCVSGFPSVFLGSQTTTNINVLVRVQQLNNVNDGVGPCFRCVDSNNLYFVALYQGLSGLIFAKLVGGSFTNIVSGVFSNNTGVYYWIRVAMSGNHLQARVWQDGNSEPSSWLIDTTDSTYASAGRFGMVFNTFVSATDTALFDHITVTDDATASSRTVPATTALQATDARGMSASVALQASPQRTIGASAALTVASVITPNVLCYVRSGSASAFVRSGQATFYVRE